MLMIMYGEIVRISPWNQTIVNISDGLMSDHICLCLIGKGVFIEDSALKENKNGNKYFNNIPIKSLLRHHSQHVSSK